jgi:SNF2 family DNA or RNA helicase
VFIHAPTKSIVLNTPDPLFIRGLLPTRSRLINHPEANVAVQHTIETTLMLRNLGIPAPSPIKAHYKFPGKNTPYEHQREMADFLTVTKKGFNLSEMGTMKTAPALWAADYLMNIGKVKRTLIICPLSIMNEVWAHGIFENLMHRTCGVVHGSVEKRLKVLNTDLDFYIINHDGISIPKVAAEIRARKDINLINVDEAGDFRNSKTDKYKFLEWIMETKFRLWLMTGTPCPNAPTDAWALARLVDKGRVPKWFGSFQRQTMEKVTDHKWVPLKGAKQIAFDAMQPAIRFLKKDCISLPPVTVQRRQTGMTPEQKKEFEAMRRDMVMQNAKGGTISAVNAADKIGKLRQILCGCVKDGDNYSVLDHHIRFNDLVGTIKQASAKTIVIVPFKGIIQALEVELKKIGYKPGVLNGDVAPAARTQVIRNFKYGDTDPLLCHPKVMSHGLNLTEADTLIFYGPIYSNDQYEQVIERNNRAGQTRPMTIVRLGAHPIEWQIYGMVDTKRFNQKGILDLYQTAIT